MRRLNVYQRWLVVFVVLLFLSLARGIVAFGIQTSVNDFRLIEFWMAGAMYFATVPPTGALYDRIAKLWVWMSLPLLAVVVARWLAVFTGIDVGVPRERFGADAAIRVINSPHTQHLPRPGVCPHIALLAGKSRSATDPDSQRGAVVVRRRSRSSDCLGCVAGGPERAVAP